MTQDFVPLHPPVAAPEPVTWSQEPPTEPGWWWVWEPGDCLRRTSINCVQVMDDDGLGLRDRNGGWLYLTELPERGFRWLPATVPQPPTWEVGP